MTKIPIIKKPGDKKNEWSLLENRIVLIICGLAAAFFIHIYLIEDNKKAEYHCRQMEYDAQNTLAAIASYFANPDHTTLPTYDQLIEEEDLVTSYPVEIEGDPEEEIIVYEDRNWRVAQGKCSYFVTNHDHPSCKGCPDESEFGKCIAVQKDKYQASIV